MENKASETLGVGNVSVEGKPQQSKRKNDKQGSSVKRRRGLDINEDPGAGLHLNFAPGFPLPSKETLIPIFKRFGLLKESEIQVICASTIHIMYERISDAKFAFRSLERTTPFGASLASFYLHGLPADYPKATVVKKRKVAMASQQHQPSSSVGKGNARLMVQNVEWMKSCVEKYGDTIHPEKRAELETELKGFLDKFGSSSSS